jgi:hypothetical protein
MAKVSTTDVMTNANADIESGISGSCVVFSAGTVHTYNPEPLTDRVKAVDYFAQEARLTTRFNGPSVDGGNP